MSMPIIDIIFWIIILITSIHGATRGFLDEFFSKLAVIAGIFFGLVLNKFLVPYLPKLGNLILLTRILAFLILFIIVYVSVRLVQKIVGVAFQGDIMQGLDKSLGFFLGIAEGFLVVGLILFLLHSQRFFDIQPVLGNSFFEKLISPLFVTAPEVVPKTIQFQGSTHV